MPRRRKRIRGTPKEYYWPCACVKRQNGRTVAIKLNHPDRQRCNICSCEQPESWVTVVDEQRQQRDEPTLAEIKGA